MTEDLSGEDKYKRPDRHAGSCLRKDQAGLPSFFSRDDHCVFLSPKAPYETILVKGVAAERLRHENGREALSDLVRALRRSLRAFF